MLWAASCLAACGGGTPAAAPDTKAPEIRDLQATLGDPNPGTLALDTADARQVISGPTPLTVRVLAIDDQSETASLKAQLLDHERKPLAEQKAALHNGLWVLTSTIKPGQTVRVSVVDEAGNATTWPHAAVFPSRSEALIRAWKVLLYTSDGTVSKSAGDRVKADSWCEDNDAAWAGPRGGTWSVLSDGRLKLETRHRLPCDTKDFGAAWNSVEQTRVSPFFVDSTYYSERPYTRKSSGTPATSWAGTWTYSVEITDNGSKKTLTPTLVLHADKTFKLQTESHRETTGTYEVRNNENYTKNFGQLLYLTATSKDGAPVKPTVAIHYVVLRGGKLLVDPWLFIVAE